MNSRSTIRFLSMIVPFIVVSISISMAGVPTQITDSHITRRTDKLQVYLQTYPSSDMDFYEAQMHLATDTISETAKCEIIDKKDVSKALGDQVPALREMQQNNWKLAKEIGQRLAADYVLIVDKSVIIGSLNLTVTLINVKSGGNFVGRDSDSQYGAFSEQNKSSILLGLSRSAYEEVVRKARKDLFEAASQKKAFYAAVKDVTFPTIVVTSPDIARGVKFKNASKILVAGTVADGNGVAVVTVNGENARLDENGKFSVEITLKTGMNQVTIIALDTIGHSATKTFNVERQGQEENISPEKGRLLPAIRTGEYYALIIGNNNYRYIPKLETAIKDAIEIEKALNGEYGFHTKLLLDATRGGILDAINYFRRSLNEEDSFLIYYAGHGEFDRIGGKAYWLPIDAQQDSDTNWIIADDLTTNLKRFSSKHVLVVADSCYSGGLSRSFNADIASKGGRKEYLNKMWGKTSRTLMASGGNEPVSDNGSGGHSVFADAFLKSLRDMDQNDFTAEELFYGYIKEIVAGKSEQTPEYNTINNSGHAGGDFIFRRAR